MIKGAKTINEFKILKWVEDTFYPDSVQVKFITGDTAHIIDRNNDVMLVSVKSGKVEVISTSGKALTMEVDS